MAVTLINPFEVAPDREAEFLEGWKHAAEAFAAKPGYLETRLHRTLDPAARFRFVNVAHWSTADAWAAAMKAFPPQEGGRPGIKGNPALYEPLADGAIEAGSRPVSDAIRDLEESLARAYQSNDAGFLDRVLSPDYLVTDGPGTTSDKRKVLDDHRNKRLLVTSFRFHETSVHVLGPDAAIAMGRYAWDASYAGRPIPGTFRYLRVYARTDGGWRLRAGQVTPVVLRDQHG